MKRHHAGVGLDVLEVHAHGLARDQVHGYRVAGEGVDDQHVVLLRGFALHGEARIAEHGIDPGLAVGNEFEITAGNLDHLRIDFVKTHGVAGAPVTRHGAGAQPHHADPDRAAVLKIFDRAPRAAGLGVIGGDAVALFLIEVLLAVHDHAVHQAPHGGVAGFRAGILHAQRAVEVARHDLGVVR